MAIETDGRPWDELLSQEERQSIVHFGKVMVNVGQRALNAKTVGDVLDIDKIIQEELDNTNEFNDL